MILNGRAYVLCKFGDPFDQCQIHGIGNAVYDGKDVTDMHIRLGDIAEMGFLQKIACQGNAESGKKFLHFHDRLIGVVKSLINDFFVFRNPLTFGKFFLFFRAWGVRKFHIDYINKIVKIMSLFLIEIIIFQLRLQLTDNAQ